MREKRLRALRGGTRRCERNRDEDIEVRNKVVGRENTVEGIELLI